MKSQKTPLSILALIISISDFVLHASVAEVVAPRCTLADYDINDSAIGNLKLASAITLDMFSERSIR